jgi:hypothetical protein
VEAPDGAEPGITRATRVRITILDVNSARSTITGGSRPKAVAGGEVRILDVPATP